MDGLFMGLFVVTMLVIGGYAMVLDVFKTFIQQLIGCLLITTAGIGICAVMTQTVYNGTNAKLKYRDELREIYQQELPKLDNNLEEISKLNPGANFLINSDSPIATTMTLRSDLIKRMTEAEREAIEAMKLKYEIESSILSMFI